MLPLNNCNPTTRLWERFASSGVLNQQLSKLWFKLVDLCMVMVMENVEDELSLSNL